LQGVRGTKEELTESPTIGFNILYIDAGQALANCSSRFISSKNSLSRGANVGSIGNEFICQKITVGREVSGITK